MIGHMCTNLSNRGASLDLALQRLLNRQDKFPHLAKLSSENWALWGAHDIRGLIGCQPSMLKQAPLCGLERHCSYWIRWLRLNEDFNSRGRETGTT